MRLVFLQFGNFAEAVHSFAGGGKETFYAQRYSVDFVNSLAAQVTDLSVVHLGRDDAPEVLPSGVRSVGIELFPAGRRPRYGEVLKTLHRLRPDHLVLVSPLAVVLGWALATGVRTLPLFADSFHARGVKAKLKVAALAGLLRNRRLDWVSNHGMAASLDLVRIGVGADKVLPFDWPAFLTAADRPAKPAPVGDEFRVIYVGAISASKGVGDLIDAAKILSAQAPPRWRFTIVGNHDGSFTRRLAELGLADTVEFVGRVSHERVVPLMNEHDAVVVPSRHEYPEGLPMTIYEGLCSRTPVVASDHPMFRLKLRDGHNALVFPASDPAALAQRLRQLAGDAALYQRLSATAEDAASDFFCPLKYHELLTRWLSGSQADRRALADFSLASGRYVDYPKPPRQRLPEFQT